MIKLVCTEKVTDRQLSLPITYKFKLESYIKRKNLLYNSVDVLSLFTSVGKCALRKRGAALKVICGS